MPAPRPAAVRGADGVRVPTADAHAGPPQGRRERPCAPPRGPRPRTTPKPVRASSEHQRPAPGTAGSRPRPHGESSALIGREDGCGSAGSGQPGGLGSSPPFTATDDPTNISAGRSQASRAQVSPHASRLTPHASRLTPKVPAGAEHGLQLTQRIRRRRSAGRPCPRRPRRVRGCRSAASGGAAGHGEHLSCGRPSQAPWPSMCGCRVRATSSGSSPTQREGEDRQGVVGPAPPFAVSARVFSRSRGPWPSAIRVPSATRPDSSSERARTTPATTGGDLGRRMHQLDSVQAHFAPRQARPAPRAAARVRR